MASRSLNSVNLIGRLGRDCETRFLPNGTAMTKFSMACDRSYKQGDEWKKETDWINVVLWAQEKLADYLKKGTQVYVGGRISSRSYENKDGQKVYVTEVVGENVILMGGAPEKQGTDEWSAPPRETGPRRTAAEALGFIQPAQQAQQPHPPLGPPLVTDEDVPF